MLSSFRKMLFGTKIKEISGSLPKLVIHIGTEKTGTTTIQEFLHTNRKHLLNHGVLFPQSIGLKNHTLLAAWCQSDERLNKGFLKNKYCDVQFTENWRNLLIEKFDNELIQTRRKVKEVIISSEHFSSFLPNDKEINNLKSLLQSRFSDNKVIVYLRRQDLLATSLYTTACLSGVFFSSILKNDGVNRPFMDYFNLLELWSRHFGKDNIIPRIFSHQAFYKNDLLSDFMINSEMTPNTKYIIPEKQNLSCSETAQDVAQLYIGRCKANNGFKDIDKMRFIRHNIIRSINIQYPGPCKKPMRFEAEDFCRKFEDSNRRVAEKWFSRAELFDNDFSMYPDFPVEGKTPEQIEKILDDELPGIQKKWEMQQLKCKL